MVLRSGKAYLNVFFKKENQPFNLILLPEKGKMYQVNIDFDESSKEWRKNKIKTGGGMFRYKN